MICTDKTGTLTQNKMTVTNVYINHSHYEIKKKLENQNFKYLALWGLLCNNTRIEFEDNIYVKYGDPTEIVLTDLAIFNGLDPINTNLKYNRIYEIPFDSERKLMTTINSIKDKKFIITKGAPEVLFGKCNKIVLDNQLTQLTKNHLDKLVIANEEMTKQALRVIAIGYREMTNHDQLSNHDQIENGLTFVGLIGMIDPPRPEVYESIRICKDAGIDTVMITGDHKNTAIAIAKQLNIINHDSEAISGKELDLLSDREFKNAIERYHVYVRVTPEHKVRIVKTWKEKGKIVAMTGDGVNDAPALKNADIGIAMGIQGTEVAKGASDMILTDNNFATIVKAVEEGRTIFTNIKKSIRFLISCNIGEVVNILLGALLGQLLFGLAVTPLNAVQLLWANLTTDSLIAIAIGLEKSEPGVMKKKSQKNSLLDVESFIVILCYGILIGLLAFVAFHIGYNMGTNLDSSITLGRTMAFMTLATTELFHAFNIRSEKYSLFKIGIFSNKFIIYAFFLSILLQYGILLFPITRVLFDITILSLNQLIIIISLSLVPIVVVEIGKLFYKEEKEFSYPNRITSLKLEK
ncbi:MAG TPA: cation-transporting P-type ATPase [Bacilli bacterium]|nr:cation-transporting P-type ATPase [Bacilli bacterium]